MQSFKEKNKTKNSSAGTIKHFMWDVTAYKLGEKKPWNEKKMGAVPKPSSNFSVYHDFDEASDPTVISNRHRYLKTRNIAGTV